MSFIDELRDIQNKINKGSQAKIIFNEILNRCGLSSSSSEQQYLRIYDMLSANDDIHNDIRSAGLKQDVSVVGRITELICQTGIEAGVPAGRYGELPKKWKESSAISDLKLLCLKM